MLTNIGGIMRDIEAEMQREREKSESLRLTCIGIRRDNIARICSKYELESDEFYTREQKAARYL